MKILTVFFSLALALTAVGQRPDDILATAAGHTFKFSDIQPEVRVRVERLAADTAKTRKSLLDQLINQRSLELEAKSRSLSVGQLVSSEKAKVPAPTETQIKAVYEANRAALGGQTIENSRKQIVAFLRRDAEQLALNKLFTRLQTKFKSSTGKDVNAAALAPADVVATVAGRAITAKEFEDFSRVDLYEMRAELADDVLFSLNSAISARLVTDEAKSQNMESQAFLGREITDKMRDYSDEERHTLEDALSARLFAKYKVNILYKLPEPLVQTISTDDDPSSGPENAPVTVVMFSDFQCSACAATHPLLKIAIADYPGKVRFVVRDFPLESIHENGFRAALAANAANAQGKFFEYSEKLYANQTALDDASLRKYAADLGLNVKQFELDFNSAKIAAEVRKDMADGESYGIGSTPTIFVNGVKVRNLSLSGLKAAIEVALRK